MDITQRCILAEVELEAKGATPGEARAAVRMARRWAVTVAGWTSPDIRERVASELLEERLRGVEGSYIKGVRRAMLDEVGG